MLEKPERLLVGCKTCDHSWYSKPQNNQPRICPKCGAEDGKVIWGCNIDLDPETNWLLSRLSHLGCGEAKAIRVIRHLLEITLAVIELGLLLKGDKK